MDQRNAAVLPGAEQDDDPFPVITGKTRRPDPEVGSTSRKAERVAAPRNGASVGTKGSLRE